MVPIITTGAWRVTKSISSNQLHVSSALSLLYYAIGNSSGCLNTATTRTAVRKKNSVTKLRFRWLGYVTSQLFFSPCVGYYTAKQREILHHYFVNIFPQRTRGWHIASPSSWSCEPPPLPTNGPCDLCYPALRISWLAVSTVSALQAAATQRSAGQGTAQTGEWVSVSAVHELT
jgi:hypothetical protein